mmetsp:Transcript_11129/g.26827  ORF Transcript_11129/g.26827 Transcript_11129/m.26827 type:complete len:98 (+) Transcript_11129:3701-3994(+)
MQKSLSLFRSQSGESRTEQYKLYSIKEVRFSRPISSNYNVGSRREGLDLWLLSETPKITDCDLFDVHGGINKLCCKFSLVDRDTFSVCWKSVLSAIG